MDELCFHILPAVRAAWGDDPTDGGIMYIRDVAADIALPAYFRLMQQIAAEPDPEIRVARFWAAHDQDAQMILRAGLIRLKANRRLTAEQRVMVRQMLKLENEAVYGS